MSDNGGEGPLLSTRQAVALCALVDAVSPSRPKVYARDLGLPGSAIGWGRTLGTLMRLGYVDGHFPSVESAGVPMVWYPTERGIERAALRFA